MVNNSQVDETDMKILNLLLQDADQTTRQIARHCQIAIGTVHSRIQKMKKSGIIRQKVIRVDYEKIGYNIEVLIEVKIQKGMFEIANKLASHPNVFLVLDITGDYDIEILARFKNRRQLDAYIKKLQRKDEVLSTRTRLILNIYREKELQSESL